MAVTGPRVSQPLPITQTEYDQHNERLVRRQIEINFQDIYVELKRVTDLIDAIIIDITHPAVTTTGLAYLTLDVATQVLTQGSVNLTSDVTANLPVTNLNNGTLADATTFWRGDGTWVVPTNTGDLWSDCVDAHIVPCTDSLYNIGSALVRFLNIYSDALNVGGNITIDGAGWAIFPNRVGVGGSGVPNNTTGDVLQVEGAMSLEGGLDFYDPISNLTHNAIFQSGTSPDIFTVLRNFQSVATLWQIISRVGDPTADDRESTMALVRTDGAGNEELVDYYNNGYHSSADRIGVAYGIRIQKRGTGLYRPFYIDWFDGVTEKEIVNIFSDDQDEGASMEICVPLKVDSIQGKDGTDVDVGLVPSGGAMGTGSWGDLVTAHVMDPHARISNVCNFR